MAWSPTLPDWQTSLWLVPLLAGLIIATASLGGWLKIAHHWRTGDTRKLFHFVIFTAAAVLQAWRGPEAVNVLGGLMAVFVALIVWRGEGALWFEALARESDRPQRGLYVVVPFLATATGGIAASWLFAEHAAVGIAVAGWGDAVAEPIGVRFGKHRYRVPNFGGGVVSERSLEGSAAVLIASFIAAWVVLLFAIESSHSPWHLFLTAFLIAIAACLVEAVSHHGLDNLTLQLTGAGLAAVMC